jgi:AAA domain
VQAGVESYSIKRLEPLCGYERQVDLRAATASLIAFEAALEDGTAAADAGLLTVAGYNEDDCRATLALRDWLEDRRLDLAERTGVQLPRPVVVEPVRAPEDPEVTRIRSALLAGVSAAAAASPSAGTDQERARVLLADLLDWHRREDKPAWWRYFRVRELSPAELIGEPDALGGLTGGEVVSQVNRSVVRRFWFPPQEYRFSRGQAAYDVETGRGWSVWAVDDANGTIELKIGNGYDGPLPAGLVEAGPIGTRELRERLRDLGDRVVRSGVGGADAATALLLRRPPSVAGPLLADGETVAEAAIRLALSLRRSYLPLQGPPGTGKTYSAAEQILALVGQGRTVGITGPSHAVIHQLIGTLGRRASARGAALRIGQRADQDNPFLHGSATLMTNEQLERALRDGELNVAAGTVWLWARPGMAESVDTLFVDEAGQLSLANVLAVAGAARNLVLLGDPQQLAQPSQGTHPPGAGASALGHILGERATMPEGAGLLLDRTYRMHPSLCRYTSEVFYDGKLHGADGLGRQEILGPFPGSGLFCGSGLRVVQVAHEGNTNASPEEAGEVAWLAEMLAGCSWRDRCGAVGPVGGDGILIVTPYNAQIRAIQDALAARGLTGFRVGTVDKFQGREAPVVIYSMATSSADDAPRGLDFLYDRHRLNVATSRARAMAIIVASPDLIRVSCRTPHQMTLVNALCRAWEEPGTFPGGGPATVADA